MSNTPQTENESREALIKAVEDAIREMRDSMPTEGVNWRGMAQTAIAAYEAAREPDWLVGGLKYETYFVPWSDRDQTADDYNCDPDWDGEPTEVETFSNLRVWFVARIALARDKHGDPIKTEVQWFRTKAEAQEAMGPAETERKR